MRSPAFLFLVRSQVALAAAAAVDTYDYVVIGAGTGGLVVANRLSEDPAVRVAVIEPGSDERSNPNVTDPDNFSKAFNTPLDWAYQTLPQPGLDGRVLVLPQGKAIGGSSAINGMTYIRGDRAVYDSWEGLGNPGWNWDALFPNFKKSENYSVPTAGQLAVGATYEAQNHGFTGPVRVGYTPKLVYGSAGTVVTEAWKTLLSLHKTSDPNGGHVHGYGMGPQTLDVTDGTRWDSARAYYEPVESRKNLVIIKGTAKRILWKDGPAAGKHGVVASGVEFVKEDGTTSVLGVSTEVVVSAGTVRTPLVLEGSGIGNPKFVCRKLPCPETPCRRSSHRCKAA